MSWIRKEGVPLAIFAVTFVISCFGYYIDLPIVSTLSSSLLDWVIIMGAFAIGVGFMAMFRRHSRLIMRKAEGYYFSFIVFASTIIMLVACIYSVETRDFWYGKVFRQLQTSILSMSAFYQFTAIYYSFRVRSIQSVGFVIAAIFLLMYNAPLYAAILPGTLDVANWFLKVPAMGASRGINIGLAIGAIALAIRILLGYDKAYGG